jgi:predicted porin
LKANTLTAQTPGVAILALACAAGGLASDARAQSNVQLYGVVDAGVVAARRGVTEKTTKMLQSGIASGSRWGFRGTEDLGSGLTASFVLESGFDSDTGALKNFSGNPSTATPTAPNGTASTGFNRRSFVSLDSPVGSIALGRDYTPFFWAGQKADIFNYGLFGNLQSVASITGTTERFARISNALLYLSPNLQGLRIRLAYSFGSESSGAAGGLPRSANHFAGVGAEYTLAGLTITASHQQVKIPNVGGTPAAFTGATTRARNSLVGARYDIGDFTLSGGWWDAGNPWNGNDVWLGASVKLGLGVVYAQVQKLRQDNPAGGAERRAHVYGVGYAYNLSRRTSLYASWGRVSNSPTSSVSLFSSDVSVSPSAPGTDPRAMAAGLRHSF